MNRMTEKRNQTFILLIMNCVKYRHKAEEQLNGWLKNVPSELLYFHVLGNPDLSSAFEFDWTNKILWVKCKDDYNSLPHKVITAYEAIDETFDYKYIFKTDDDQMLKTESFFPTIMKLLETKAVDYGGSIVDVPFSHISKYFLYHPELPRNLVVQKTKYCNGRFYLLSKDAVQDLLLKKDIIQKEYLEDYAIGFHLNDKFKKYILPIDSKKYFEDGTV